MNADRRPMRRRTSQRGATVVALVGLALALGGCGGDSSEGGDPTDPAAVVVAFYDSFNEQDLIAAMEFFAADAVMTGHPFGDRAVGIAELTRVMRQDMANAAPSDSTQLVNLITEGNTVTFGHIYTDWLGDCYSGGGAQIVVEDGKIVRYDWGTYGQFCD